MAKDVELFQETMMSSIKLTIERDWTSKDLVKFLEIFETLYDYVSWSESLAIFIQASTERDSLPDINKFHAFFKHSPHILFSKRKKGLHIKSLKYNSPGWIELFGHGVIVTAIALLIKNYIPNRGERLNSKKLEQEILSAQIENLQKLGYNKMDIQEFLIKSNKPLFDSLFIAYPFSVQLP